MVVLPYEQLRADPQGFVSAIVSFSGLASKEALVQALPYGDNVNPSLSGVSLALMRRLNLLIGQRTPHSPWVLFPSRQQVGGAFTW